MENQVHVYTLGEIMDNALKDSAARSVIAEFQRIDALSVSDSLKQQCKEDLLAKFADKAAKQTAPKVSEVQRLRDTGRKIDAVQLVRELSAYGISGGDRIGSRHAKNIVERM